MRTESQLPMCACMRLFVRFSRTYTTRRVAHIGCHRETDGLWSLGNSCTGWQSYVEDRAPPFGVLLSHCVGSSGRQKGRASRRKIFNFAGPLASKTISGAGIFGPI